MLLNALELDNITARQVMVPRTRIFSLPSDLNLDEALSRVVDEQHSRVPVYDPQRGPEHIVGVLYAKDLMRWTRLRLGHSAAPSCGRRHAHFPDEDRPDHARCAGGARNQVLARPAR